MNAFTDAPEGFTVIIVGVVALAFYGFYRLFRWSVRRNSGQ